MCMQLYIGLDNTLSEADGRCYPWELDMESKDDCFAENNLTMKYKYGLMGCACGLKYDLKESIDTVDDILFSQEEKERFIQMGHEDNKCRKQMVEDLLNYLRDNVKADKCELLSFWAGEYKMEYNDVLDLKNIILGDTFSFFKEGQYITVIK